MTMHQNGRYHPGVQLQPEVGRDLWQGLTQIASAVRPTLGPTPRLVAVGRSASNAPELLDCGATIARRIIALPQQQANVGAMLSRAVIWQVHEAVMDGTTTAAVIFEQAVASGLRALAAGADPWSLRRELTHTSARIVAELDAMAAPVSGKAQLTRLAMTHCQDPELAPLIGEILDVVGPEGQVDVHAAPGRRCDREYAEGMYWSGGVVSHQFITDQTTRRIALTDCGILITDFDLNDPADIVLIVQQAKRAGLGALVITAQRLSDAAIGALLTDPMPAFAVKIPGAGETNRMVAQQDLAVLTGGKVFSLAAGDTARQVTPADFGRARIAWASRDLFGLIGGKGDPRRLRAHINGLRQALRDSRDQATTTRLQERLGKLLSGSATLNVGGATATETDARRDNAKRTVSVLRGMLVDGVVPGGGRAYLACGQALAATRSNTTTESARQALEIAIEALEAPARTIWSNAGHEPSALLTRLAKADPGIVVDARDGSLVKAAEAGIQDSAAVAKAAVSVALAAAGQVLTIDAVVSPRSPATATTPLG